jgi:hypothetical protein
MRGMKTNNSSFDALLRRVVAGVALATFVMAGTIACGGDDEPKPAGTVVEDTWLVIHPANIDSPLSSSEVPATGEMPSPVGDEVLLYDWSKLTGFGGTPGSGNTIIGGSRATVFKTLDEVEPGALFSLRWNGRDFGYSVTSLCFWDSRRGTGFESVVATTTDETLTLITSYGPSGNVELGRLVVTAKPRTLVVSPECPAGLLPLERIDFEPAR